MGKRVGTGVGRPVGRGVGALVGTGEGKCDKVGRSVGVVAYQYSLRDHPYTHDGI